MTNPQIIPDLIGNITLYGKTKETFRILKTQSHGASLRCYQAENNKIKGVLKEYCPDDAPLLRDRNGYLVFNGTSEEKRKDFFQHMNNYTRPYHLISDAIKENSELSTFFPDAELFFSSADDVENKTVYIWEKGPVKKTFESLCMDIRKNPETDSVNNILNILKAIRSLASCISLIHKTGLIHRDIKPENFGFTERNGEFLYQIISLFDIDTICSVYETDKLPAVGSPGFHEPETDCPANNLTDIYSIGATLFSALIITDITAANNFYYAAEFYDDIKDLVYNSELIKPILNDAPDEFFELIIRILKKSLCPRRKRYDSCEKLINDIEQAINLIQPLEANSKAVSENRGKWTYQTQFEQFYGQQTYSFTIKTFLEDDEIRKIELLVKADKRSDPVCCEPDNAFILGVHYYALKDNNYLEKAKNYLRISADSGNKNAGNIYTYMCRSEDDKYDEIITARAINNNCVLTMYDRACYWLYRKHGEPKAKKLLLKAAELGDYASMYLLALLCINTNISFSAFRLKSSVFTFSLRTQITAIKFKCKESLILKFILFGVERKIPHFIMLHADMYKVGFGFKQNTENAIKLYSKLISKNVWEAYIGMHDCCILKHNYELAINYLITLSQKKEAGKYLNERALELLSDHYYKGDIVPKDIIKSAQYYFKKAEIFKHDSTILFRIRQIADEAEKEKLLSEAATLGIIGAAELKKITKLSTAYSSSPFTDIFDRICDRLIYIALKKHTFSFKAVYNAHKTLIIFINIYISLIMLSLKHSYSIRSREFRELKRIIQKLQLNYFSNSYYSLPYFFETCLKFIEFKDLIKSIKSEYSGGLQYSHHIITNKIHEFSEELEK